MKSTDNGRAAAEALLPDVSRETWARLSDLVALVRQWQPAVNLVSPQSLPHIWTRHVADSAQCLRIAPNALRWIDLGSGGGFPGLVIAAALAGRGAQVELVESDQRKAAFLREAVRTLRLPARVHAARVETVLASGGLMAEIVVARALAPLPRLLMLAAPLLKSGAVGLFPKGQDAERELTDARKSWTLDAELIPSVTDARARLVLIRRAKPRQGPSAAGRA